MQWTSTAHYQNYITAEKVLKMTYYDKEIQKLGNSQADLKLIGYFGETRWMTVTPEQIQAILEILNKNEVKE
jgi:hypothetical protein